MKMSFEQFKCFSHAKKRFEERYGKTYTNRIHKFLLKKIAEGDVLYHYTQKNTEGKRFVYIVEYKGEAMKMVFDQEVEEIVTFLPVKQRQKG